MKRRIPIKKNYDTDEIKRPSRLGNFRVMVLNLVEFTTKGVSHKISLAGYVTFGIKPKIKGLLKTSING